MPRKNDSRVAVTRSRPRSRPALIVAPDRDTPGINEKHWATPMIRMSVQDRSVSWRSCFARASATTITTLQMIRAPATNHRLRRAPSMRSFAVRPTTATGIEPTITYSAIRQSALRRPSAPVRPRKKPVIMREMSLRK